MTTTLMVGLIILGVLAIATIFLQVQFLRILRDYHADEWRRLGSPTLLLNNSVSNSFSVLKFLVHKEYEAIGDDRLTRISGELRVLGITYVAGFLLVTSALMVHLIGV